MGGGDLARCDRMADWLAKTGYVDPKKIAVMGGSYGGYLTMMAVTKAPDNWAAGVPIVPFVNWFTEIQNEDPLLQQYDMATMGDPMKDKARLAGAVTYQFCRTDQSASLDSGRRQ